MVYNNQYRNMNSSELTRFKLSIKDIESVALYIKENFMNKLVTFNSKSHTIPLTFQSTNFQHLCGIKYEYGAKAFFESCIAQNINLEKVKIKADNTTFQKLSVLPLIKHLLSNKTSICPGGILNHIDYDSGLSTSNSRMLIPLKLKRDSYVMISLLNMMRHSHEINNVEKVTSIFSKDFHTRITTKLL
ncbi:hypothetical protein KHQ89_04660 [Mycoplasmatota bacterium]|nr:hypothetical protein KHQ89_04660 [Mycoplasmatota bacterium]